MSRRLQTVCVLTLALTACGEDGSSLADAATGDAQSPFDAGLAIDGAHTPEARLDAATPADASAPMLTRDAALIDASNSDAARFPGLPSCSANTLAPGKSSFTLMRDGAARAVNVYTPRDYDGAKALPLVIDFHGLHEGASLHEATSNWDDAVDKNQFIVALPQGIQNAWNVGPCCTESRSVDDVAFARDLVARIANDGCVDTRRIYATGYSNGGGMTHELACEAADLFAAFAPAAFDLLEEMTCTPARPLSIFIFRGTDDPIVPYAGGASTPPTLYPLAPIHFLGAPQTFARWAELNGCTGAPTDTGSGCNTYTACRDDVKVTLCTAQGGGHDPSDVARAWPMLSPITLP